jgi:hypothetical protein
MLLQLLCTPRTHTQIRRVERPIIITTLRSFVAKSAPQDDNVFSRLTATTARLRKRALQNLPTLLEIVRA